MSRRLESLTLLWHGPVNRTTAVAIANGDTAAVYTRHNNMWHRATHPMTIAQVSRWWTRTLPRPLPSPAMGGRIDRLIRDTVPTGAVR